MSQHVRFDDRGEVNGDDFTSRAISRMVTTYSIPPDQMEEAERTSIRAMQTEQLRDHYLRTFDTADDPLVVLIGDSQEKIEETVLEPCQNNNNHEKFQIQYKDQLYDQPDNGPLRVGRYHGGADHNKECDVKLIKEHNGSSRLHAIVYFYPNHYVPNVTDPNKGVILVVDVGSMEGIRTISRPSGKPKVDSLPRNRNILIFEWNESAVLQLATEKIVLTPKTCIICLSEPRTKKFQCGHYLTCETCALRLFQQHSPTCPICRAPIINIQDHTGLRTNAFVISNQY